MVVEKLNKKNLMIFIGIILVFADIVPFIKNDGTPNAPLGNMFSVGAMLAPYLIAERPLFRMYFWQKLLNVGRFQNPTCKFIVMGILLAIVTVLVCSLIDKIYEFIRIFFRRIQHSY